MFCTNCGSKVNDSDKFCINCGNQLKKYSISSSNNVYETVEFSSNILLGGDILTPNKIIITNDEVIYRKRNKYLIGIDEISIPLNKISSVEIDRGLIDSSILIYSTGNKSIKADDFSISAAKKIKQIIQKRSS